MGFAFSHLITAWLIGKGYEFISGKKINHYTWFFLLFGAVFPDAEFLFDWTIGTHLHRTFTHSLFFVVVSAATIYMTFALLKDKKRKHFAFAIGIGILAHMFLDAFSTKGIPLLWPSLSYFSFASGILYDPQLPTLLSTISSDALKKAITDMGLGTAWMFYFWRKNQIKF